MAEELIHELAAGYALDALGPDEERTFEAHLAHCPRCQADVAAFLETAAQLGFATPAAPEPPELRERILDAARRQRSNVVTLRPRWAYPALAAAVAASVAAVGLGVWAATLQSGPGSAQALQGLPLHGATGSVVVGRGGEAALVVSGLSAPPAGKTYEIWVIRGTSAEPAGLFSPANRGTSVVRLARHVSSGDRVGVTVEPTGGSTHPTSTPVVLSATA